MPFWKRKSKPSQIYYLHPRPWYRRPRRTTAVHRPRQKSWLNRARPLISAILSRFLYRVLLVSAIALGAIGIFLSSMFSIQTIEVVRKDLNIDSAKVENSLSDYKGEGLVFTSKKNLADKIAKNFPEFKTIQVKKILPDRIQINLEAYPRVANMKAYYTEPKDPSPISSQEFSALNQAIQELAQGNGAKPTAPNSQLPTPNSPIQPSGHQSDPQSEVPEKPIEQKALINAIGQAIFDRDENLELMTIVIQGLTKKIADRQEVIPPDQMNYIMSAIDYFQTAMNLDVSSLYYFASGREIHLKTHKGLFIWLTFEQSFKDQIDKLKAIYETAELSKEDLSYIDLRVREKVIYCPRQSSCRKWTNE